ncbi:MAG: DHA2 family efflux MFS transporter permease subunit, partial [Desulfofundulus sp.]
MALFTIITGMSMDLMDMTIVNVAIPNLMSVFNVSVNEVQWVATAYMMTLGIVIPITDYLATTRGMKKVFLTSIILFTTGSALCGLAWNLHSLIFFRVIQAVGGGMIMPLGIAILYKIFTEKERGLAMGLIGVPLLAAPALGPVLGGYLVEHADWRLIFFINIPVGIITILLTYITLDEFETQPEKLDLWGFLLSAGGLGGLLLALSNGPTDGWGTPYIVYLLVISIFLLLLFILWELGHPRPLLELRLFTSPIYSLSMLLSVFSIMSIVGCLFLLPVFLQELQGYSPMKTGLILLPEALAAAAILPISGLLVNRV